MSAAEARPLLSADRVSAAEEKQHTQQLSAASMESTESSATALQDSTDSASTAAAGSLRLSLILAGQATREVTASPEWTLERLVTEAVSAEILRDEGKRVVTLYIGRNLPESARGRSLADLGFRDRTAVHFVVQDRVKVAEQAAAARSSYQQQHNAEFEPRGDAAAEHFLPIRDHWEEEDFAHSFRIEREGSWAEFGLGTSIGLLLGLLSFILFLQPGISRRMRFGICLGVFLNALLGFWVQMQHPNFGPFGTKPDEKTHETPPASAHDHSHHTGDKPH